MKAYHQVSDWMLKRIKEIIQTDLALATLHEYSRFFLHFDKSRVVLAPSQSWAWANCTCIVKVHEPDVLRCQDVLGSVNTLKIFLDVLG